MERHELNDREWDLLSPVIPHPHSYVGRPPKDPRILLNGIIWILKTGSPWRDLPKERFGSWETYYHHFREWERSGVFAKIIEVLTAHLDENGLIDWDIFCVDGTNVRATRSAGGAEKKSPEIIPEEPPDHALGKSRGGFGTKIHLATDGKGSPLKVVLTAGQVHESTVFEAVVESCLEERKPEAVSGDKGYSAGHIRKYLEDKGIKVVIPYRCDESGYQDPDNQFDRNLYKKRSVVEQCVGWLKECRRVVTRFEKLAVRFLAMVQLAASLLLLRRI